MMINKKMEENIDIIKNIDTSLKLENMQLEENDKNIISSYLNGDISKEYAKDLMLKDL